jgi:hypothetical protein
MVLFSRTTKTRLRGFVIDEKIALPRKAAFWRKGMDMTRQDWIKAAFYLGFGFVVGVILRHMGL